MPPFFYLSTLFSMLANRRQYDMLALCKHCEYLRLMFMCNVEARHGSAFKGLLNRYFTKA